MSAQAHSYRIRIFLPFALAERSELLRVLEAMAATKYFKPTHIGVDERKRKKFSEVERDNVLDSIGESGQLYLWHAAGGRDAEHLTLAKARPSYLAMGFYGEKALADAKILYAEFETMVGQFPPCLASFAVVPGGTLEDAELQAYLKSIARRPESPTEVYFCGVGGFSAATYLDSELGERLEPALAELGAERLPDGAWKLLAKEAPWASTALEAAEFTRKTGIALRKYGLQGRVDGITGKYHPAPNWRRPDSWTGIDLRLERKVSTPNV